MPVLLTAAEVADRLRVKKSTIDKWRQRSRGPRFVKIGTDGPSARVRYTEEALADYIAQAEAKPSA